MEIVACLDRAFIMPTGVMLYSVCANNREENINFHIVIDESVSDKDEKDIIKTITDFDSKKVFIYRISSDICKGFPIFQVGRLFASAYYRLFLSEILPETVDKVLYLDGDCIVRHSLLPLWNLDLEDNAIAAVPDCKEGDITKYNRLRFSPQLGYFNAGVLLINLDYWRRHRVVELFTDFAVNHHDQIQSEDQDVLNATFCNSKKNLPIKYNLISGYLRIERTWDYWKYETDWNDALNDPVIIHFTGRKPWYKNDRFPHPFRSSFFKYQEQTMWKGYREDRCPMKARLRYFVGDSLRLLKLKAPLKPQFIDVPPVD